MKPLTTVQTGVTQQGGYRSKSAHVVQLPIEILQMLRTCARTAKQLKFVWQVSSVHFRAQIYGDRTYARACRKVAACPQPPHL
jgi:hypothetical protein